MGQVGGFIFYKILKLYFYLFALLPAIMFLSAGNIYLQRFSQYWKKMEKKSGF